MKRNCYVGCSGWYYSDWAGKFYPEKGSRSKWLEYYSRKFQTVEVNNTFYRFPNEKTLQGWYDRTPKDFKFSLKANQLITHRRRFKNTEGMIKRFYRLSDLLEDKLAFILFQIPPNKQKDLYFLKSALEQLDPLKNNVIEFRHPSWFDSEVYDLLNDFKVIFCSISSPDLPDNLIELLKRSYIRFHGKYEGDKRYRYFYTKEELNEWAQRIKKSKAMEIFCYFNNDYNANAPNNAFMLKELLKEL